MKNPIIKSGDNIFTLTVEKERYSNEAIVAACYKYTDKFYIFQRTSPNDEKTVEVIFENKEDKPVTEKDVKQFCNELIDQQVRYNTNKQFGHIRDLIVEEAFKPVSK